MRNKKQFKKVVRIYTFDGDTEKNYLKSLFSDRYKGVSVDIQPKLKNTIEDIMDYVLEEAKAHETADLKGLFLIVDMDVVYKNDKIHVYQTKRKKMKSVRRRNVALIESLPCIEYWFLLHYVFQDKLFVNCEEVLKELKKNGRLPDYDKTNNYTKRVYEKLKEDINKAIKNSKKGYTKKRQPKEQFSYTNIYEMIEKLDSIYNSDKK